MSACCIAAAGAFCFKKRKTVPGGSLKKIAIPLLALLLLAGGGAGAYFYFGKGAEASIGAEAEKAALESDGEALKITYVEMDPIILPIIGRDGISQTVSMVVSIQVADDLKAEEVRQHLPRLADAYLSDMYGTLSQQAAMDAGVIKVSMLKSRLAAITHKVMGEGVVQDVLLQVLQQHKS